MFSTLNIQDTCFHEAVPKSDYIILNKIVNRSVLCDLNYGFVFKYHDLRIYIYCLVGKYNSR